MGEMRWDNLECIHGTSVCLIESLCVQQTLHGDYIKLILFSTMIRPMLSDSFASRSSITGLPVQSDASLSIYLFCSACLFFHTTLVKDLNVRKFL